MRDHVTEEQISAYVDGELEGDELELVEAALAESTEYQQLAAELLELRASMETFPSFNLPADFNSKVVAEIEGLGPPPSEEPVSRKSDGNESHPWRRVFVAVAALAAMITFTVMIRPGVPPDEPGLDPPPVQTLPVYLQKVPPQQYIAVYDVTVTGLGQENDIITKLLQKHGFGIDPGVKLGAELEDDLIALRTPAWNVPEKAEPLKKRDGDADGDERVEMIYIAGMTLTLGNFGEDLRQTSFTSEELEQFQLDMVFQPKQIEVMRRLHQSASEFYASTSRTEHSEFGQAFRLSFRVELTSLSVPGVASFPMPTVVPNQGSSSATEPASTFTEQALTNLDVDNLSVPVAPSPEDGEQEVATARAPLEEELLPGHVLLIVRYKNVDEDDVD